ncbi:putative MFS family arabinose efflux permease [Melghirimyces profundicolus]|uniref:Putative MFS family arabinose efflux permease n=1 Tax=Melghirimyces profundicolus TaxID=1242148 RepID=A0A2T6B2N6_9BACL|nr:MFS transporter [Melghirimyces profundicolus]PTX50336.1 putative MFS family arabinose efflux permease [Melghirimyces profundicolus]
MNDRRTYHPLVWLLLVSTGLGRTSVFMVLPFLTLHLSKMGYTAFEAGQVVGAGWLVGSLGGLIGGFVSDRWGRMPVLLTSLFFWSLTFYGFALAESFGFFLLLSVMNGVCRSFYDTISKSLLTDLVPKKDQARILGRSYLSLNLALAVGPLLGVYFAQYSSVLVFVVTGSVMSFLVIVMGWADLQYRGDLPPFPGPGSGLSTVMKSAVRDTSLLFALLMGIIFTIGYAQIETTLPLHLKTESLSVYPALLTTNAILVVLFAIPMSNWAGSQSPIRVILISSLLFAAGLVLFGTDKASLLFAGMAVITLAETMFFPVWEAGVAQLGQDRGMKGVYLGSSGMIQLGFFVGPVLGGWLLDRTGGTVTFGMMGALALSILLMPLWVRFRDAADFRQETEEAA